MSIGPVWFSALCVAFLLSDVAADEINHRYESGDPVTVWAGKAGPLNTPQEKYTHEVLPLCHPDTTRVMTARPAASWGERLQGEVVTDAGFQAKFKRDQPRTKLCSQDTRPELVAKATTMIQRQFVQSMSIDELPVYSLLGKIAPAERGGPREHQIYTFYNFTIHYNHDRIISAVLDVSDPITLQKPTFPVYYQVTWYHSDIPFVNRFDAYLDPKFFKNRVHWFAIVNSFCLVLVLVGLVSTILTRNVRSDLHKYELIRAADDSDDEVFMSGGTNGPSPDGMSLLSTESGWKLVAGDVFRPPDFLPLLCALVGTGMQLTYLAFGTIVTSLAGSLYISTGLVVEIMVLGYFATAGFAGYYSGGLYARNGGTRWIFTLYLTATLVPGCAAVCIVLVNLASLLNRDLIHVVPYQAVFKLSLVWALTALPLTAVGTLLGRAWRGKAKNPCRINPIPRPLLAGRKARLSLRGLGLGAGLVSFLSVTIESYYVISSFFNYKFFFVFDYLLVTFLMLLAVTACSTIVVVYTLLNWEDYRWAWTSFLSGFSISFWLLLYSLFFFLCHTHISGAAQTLFYFTYTGMFCLLVGVLNGAVAYTASSVFVRVIYNRIKTE